jgi:hypothetical protein
MTEQFWLNDPSMLLNKKYVGNLWIYPGMSLDSRLNAITRIVIILSIVGFILTKSIQLCAGTIATIIVIALWYKSKEGKETKKKQVKFVKEAFTNPKFYKEVKSSFTTPTKKNPLMNVALPEIVDNPKRKAAAPSFNPQVETEINDAVKENLDPRIFRDLGDNIIFDQSMRNFNTMPNTQIPNDQKAFAEFCYGNMPSCKEGDDIQCVKENYRHILR